MKNSTKIIALFVLVIAGLSVWSLQGKIQSSSTSGASSSFNLAQIEIKETGYDFGSVSMRKGLVDYNYAVKNISSETLRVGEATTSCMCTTAFLSLEGGREVGPFGMPGHGDSGLWKTANLKIEPNQVLNVRAVFDPAAHGPAGVGFIEREIYLDFGGSEPVVLSFKVNVTP
ncbi:MAG: DUF1573 domain-containing protein [Candidatus Colwellbacteria bacterium]|nr:DUF1573 domain-containing protein [Candidatus Colwellbacteria bacterium]